jgi:hypothetical protein
MPRKKKELSRAAFLVAKRAGLTRAKTPKAAKLSPSARRTVEMTVASKKAKTRNVFVPLIPSKLRAVRKDGLDIVPTKAKGGMFVRVPKNGKRVKVIVKAGEVSVSWTAGKKRFRRVDTPMKPKEWVGVDSRAFANQGKKKGEKLEKITVAVAGYDSTNFYTPGVYAQYITNDFGPSVRKFKKKPKNFFAVRRVYASKTGTRGNTKRRVRSL